MIIVIDNYDSFTYNLVQYLSQHLSDVRVIRNDKISVQAVLDLNPDGIVLSPGPGRPEQAGLCIELIQSISDNLPLLGVCLGLQALAIALGGKVIQAPTIVHGKPDKIFHQGGRLYQALPSPFDAGRYHSLMVERESLPDTLLIESYNSDGLIMGLRHTTQPLFGVQFHPESILTPLGNQLLNNFVHECQRRSHAA